MKCKVAEKVLSQYRIYKGGKNPQFKVIERNWKEAKFLVLMNLEDNIIFFPLL